MSGIAIVIDLIRKKPTFYSAHSHGVLSATVAASAAAASVAASAPFASRFLFGNSRIPIAYCDAGIALPEDNISDVQKTYHIENLPYDALKYSSTKEYRIELKPLFSAFGFRALAMTSVRSLLMFYLPLLEPRTDTEDDEDFSQEATEEQHLDLVVPLKKSGTEIDGVDTKEQARVLGKRVFGTTVKCGSSLVFASVGAGIGATLLRPSLGQWMGCLAGDFAGPVIVTACFNRFLHMEL